MTVYTSSRRSSSVVLLPFNFNGRVELHSRRGETSLLPGLASHGRVVRSRSGELQLVIGDAAGQDFVRMDTRRGSLRVGLSGVDDGVAVQGRSGIAGTLLRAMGSPGMLGNLGTGTSAKQSRF